VNNRVEPLYLVALTGSIIALGAGIWDLLKLLFSSKKRQHKFKIHIESPDGSITAITVDGTSMDSETADMLIGTVITLKDRDDVPNNGNVKKEADKLIKVEGKKR